MILLLGTPLNLTWMNKEHRDKDFLKRPYYPGGLKAMRLFIKEHLIYPPEALKEKIEGTVALKYEIDYKGKVQKVKVIAGIGSGCDEEAIRLVKLFKFKIEKNRKLRVKFFKNIQIHFKLPSQQKQNIKLDYKLSKSAEKGQNKQSDGYSYTVNF